MPSTSATLTPAGGGPVSRTLRRGPSAPRVRGAILADRREAGGCLEVVRLGVGVPRRAAVQVGHQRAASAASGSSGRFASAGTSSASTRRCACRDSPASHRARGSASRGALVAAAMDASLGVGRGVSLPGDVGTDAHNRRRGVLPDANGCSHFVIETWPNRLQRHHPLNAQRRGHPDPPSLEPIRFPVVFRESCTQRCWCGKCCWLRREISLG